MKIQSVNPVTFKSNMPKVILPAVLLSLTPAAYPNDTFEKQNPSSININAAENEKVINAIADDGKTANFIESNRIINQLNSENKTNPNFSITKNWDDSYLIKTKYNGIDVKMSLELSQDDLFYQGKLQLNDGKNSKQFNYAIEFSDDDMNEFQLQLTESNSTQRNLTIKRNTSDDKLFVIDEEGNIHELNKSNYGKLIDEKYLESNNTGKEIYTLFLFPLVLLTALTICMYTIPKKED